MSPYSIYFSNPSYSKLKSIGGCAIRFRMETKTARPTWQAYFMAVASLVASRSTCLRRQVGAVIAVDNRLIGSGYNGSPSGVTHCLDIGCIREKQNVPSGQRLDLCKANHAEANAITQAARYGTPIDGATMYCTTLPCTSCSKLIIQSGIRRVVFSSAYPDTEGVALLREAGVETVQA